MEFEDKAWLPPFIRNALTGVLGTAERILGIYKPVSRLIEEKFPVKEILITDLCTGSGEGVVSVINELKQKIEVSAILTDLYPNLQSAAKINSQNHCINYILNSMPADVAAQKFPADLYTVFAGFHHFNQPEKLELTKLCTRNGSSFLIVEGAESSILTYAIAAIFLPFLTWLTLPFIRPFHPGWIIFTYLVPIIPILVWWDGLASLTRIKKSGEVKSELASFFPEISFTTGGKKIGPGIKVHWILMKEKDR